MHRFVPRPSTCSFCRFSAPVLRGGEVRHSHRQLSHLNSRSKVLWREPWPNFWPTHLHDYLNLVPEVLWRKPCPNFQLGLSRVLRGPWSDNRTAEALPKFLDSSVHSVGVTLLTSDRRFRGGSPAQILSQDTAPQPRPLLFVHFTARNSVTRKRCPIFLKRYYQTSTFHSSVAEALCNFLQNHRTHDFPPFW